MLESCRNMKGLFDVVTAESAYSSKQYDVAAHLLIEKYNKEKNLQEQAEIALQIAESYRLNNKTISAEEWYKKVYDINGSSSAMYKYGLMLKANGKYPEAEKLFTQFTKSNPADRALGKKQLLSVQMAMEWKAKPTPHLITNLDINSPASDYAPVLISEKMMVFSSARSSAKGDESYGWTGEKHSDLFISNMLDYQSFSGVDPFPDPINGEYNEGTATFTADGKKMIFTRCGSLSKKNDYCHLYESRQDSAGRWSLPEQLILFESDSINTGQPFLTVDGKTLYFSANAPDGIGDKDIYYTEWKNNAWTRPKNLGPEINTSAYEGFPYIGIDGWLYFASDGHPGMGGLDIFKATHEGRKWVKIKNLQYPVNSPADDFALIQYAYLDPSRSEEIASVGFFTSARTGGKGNDDIYLFVEGYPKPDTVPPALKDAQQAVIYLLIGTIKEIIYSDAEDPRSPVKSINGLEDAAVEILGLDLSSRIDSRLSTDIKGQFQIELEPNTDYKLTAAKGGFFTQSSQVTTRGLLGSSGDTIIISAELTLDRIFKQREVVLPDIYYDLDSYAIREEAKPVLQNLAQLLMENPDIHIELGSHTDSRGSTKYNQILSQNRAQSVVDYIVSKGISSERMTAIGYGESALVNGCTDNVTCTEEQHQQNRRTTFKVL